MKPIRIAAILVSLAASGCLSHIPPVGDAHMKIHWAPGWEAASREAALRDKPLLACLIAGEITGLC
jgi:hypothetical protein